MFIKEFNNYAKKFDLKNKHIMGKYHHSFRVMEFAHDIAVSLNLSEDDIRIASICGLFHDFGRFKQWTDYKTYEDCQSTDHGDLGVEELIKEDFLKKYTEEVYLVLKTVKYHNKFDVKESDERILLFSKIVRDADKLDIVKEQANQIFQEKIILKEELLNSIYTKKLCQNEFIKNEVDQILRMLAWIFDMNFSYSLNYLKEQKIIDKKFDLLSIYGETEELKKLKEFINQEIEKRI